MAIRCLLLFVLSIALFSCQSEWLDSPQKQDLPADGFVSLDGFQDYYWQTYNQSDLRSASVEGNRLHTDLVIEGASPVWTLAQKQIIGDSLRILSVPMEGARVLAPLSETLDSVSAVQHSEKLFRLYLVNRSLKGDVGRGASYYVYIKPSLKWLESGREYPVNFNAVPKGFDGEIELYSLNGELQQRLVFTEGKKAVLYTAEPKDDLRTIREFYDRYDNANMQDYMGEHYRIYLSSSFVINYGHTRRLSEDEYQELKHAFGNILRDYPESVSIPVRIWELHRYESSDRNYFIPRWIDEDFSDNYLNSYWDYYYFGGAGSSGEVPERTMKKLYLRKDVQAHISGELHGFTMYSAKQLNTIFTKALEDTPYRRMIEHLSKEGFRISDIFLKEDRPGERAAITQDKNQLRIYGIEKFTPKSLKHELFHLYQKHIMQRDPRLVKIDTTKLRGDELEKALKENDKIHLEIMKRRGFREFEVRLLENIQEFIEIKGESKEFFTLSQRLWIAQNESYYDFLLKLTDKGTRYPERIAFDEFQYWGIYFGKYGPYPEGSIIYQGQPHIYEYYGVDYKPTAIEAFFREFCK